MHAADYGNRVAGSFIPALVALAQRLRERGDSMAFVATAIEGAVWHDDVRRAGIELFLEANTAAIAQRVGALAGDIAHVHFFDLHVPVTKALWSSRQRLFWHVHSKIPELASPIRRAKGIVRYRIIGSRVERFIAASRGVADELRVVHAPRAKIALAVNAVDTARFRPPSAFERTGARRALGIEDDRRTFLFFGRDRQIKGGDIVEAAVARLDRPRLIGVGIPASGLEALRASADLIALENVADTRTLFWASDALLLPSRGEGLPYVVIEGLACGIPVLASDIPAVAEVREAASGIRLAGREDPVALAAAMQADAPVVDCEAIRRGFGLARWVDDIVALYGTDAATGGAAK